MWGKRVLRNDYASIHLMLTQVKLLGSNSIQKIFPLLLMVKSKLPLESGAIFEGVTLASQPPSAARTELPKPGQINEIKGKRRINKTLRIFLEVGIRLTTS